MDPAGPNLTDQLILKLVDAGVATICVAGLLWIIYVLIVRFTRSQDRLFDNLTNPDRERDERHPLERRRPPLDEDGENMANDPPKK